MNRSGRIALLILLILCAPGCREKPRAARSPHPGLKGLEIELPQAAAAKIEVPESLAVVAIDRDGKLTYGGLAVTPETLGIKVRMKRERDPDLQVIIAADKRVPHGKVVQVIDLLRTQGVTRISLGTVMRRPSAPLPR